MATTYEPTSVAAESPAEPSTTKPATLQFATIKPDTRVGRHYRILRKIGAGPFSDVYLGVNDITNEEVAIKVLKIENSRLLKSEASIYKDLAGGNGIPFIRELGETEDGRFCAMVMDLLGPALPELKSFCDKTFSLRTILLLLGQVLHIVEYVHSKGIVIRNITPDDILMGIGQRAGQCHIIGFHLAKYYRNPNTHEHIPYHDYMSHTGTPRYISANAHTSEASRRDDLISVLHSFIYMALGSLPWSGLNAATKEEHLNLILEKKESTTSEAICHGLPDGFRRMYGHVRALRFKDEPDYRLLEKLCKDMFTELNLQGDNFDWSVKKAPIHRALQQQETGILEVYPIEFMKSDYAIPLQPVAGGPSLDEAQGELEAIYSRLEKAEPKCIEMTKRYSDGGNLLSNADCAMFFKALRELLFEYCQAMLMPRSPSAPAGLQCYAEKKRLPERLWQHGVQEPLELLRLRMHREYRMSFLYFAYNKIMLLYDKASALYAWLECLDELRNQMRDEERKG